MAKRGEGSGEKSFFVTITTEAGNRGEVEKAGFLKLRTKELRGSSPLFRNC